MRPNVGIALAAACAIAGAACGTVLIASEDEEPVDGGARNGDGGGGDADVAAADGPPSTDGGFDAPSDTDGAGCKVEAQRCRTSSECCSGSCSTTALVCVRQQACAASGEQCWQFFTPWYPACCAGLSCAAGTCVPE